RGQGGVPIERTRNTTPAASIRRLRAIFLVTPTPHLTVMRGGEFAFFRMTPLNHILFPWPLWTRVRTISSKQLGQLCLTRRGIPVCKGASFLHSPVKTHSLRRALCMIPADMKVFISHSSKNKRVAGRLCDDLRRKKIEVWLDRDQLHSGDPLIDDLQAAITESTHFLLLWSKPASESRYVKAEWQAAYDLEKVIISCFLDKTPLPLFLRRLKFCDMRGSYLRGWREIIGALEGESPRPKAKKLQTTQPEKQAVIDALYRGQQTVLEILEAGDLARANREQEKLDHVMNDAVRRWRSDDVILNLGGYQLKNSYQIKYWDQVSNRRYPYPADPMLAKA